MKKIIFISILVVMLAAISGNAKAQSRPGKKTNSEFAQYLKKQLHDFEWVSITDEDMTFKLFFEYTLNNKIVILNDSIGNNCVICEYIQREFDKDEYSGNDLIPGKSYFMKVNLVLK